MTEVQKQLEANGLPTSFGTTSDQSKQAVETASDQREKSHSVDDVSQLKQNAMDLESLAVARPAEPTEMSVVPETQPNSFTNDVSMSNGHSAGADVDVHDARVNGHGALNQVDAEKSAVQAAEVAMESVVPSSIPSEVQSSAVADSTSLNMNLLPQSLTLPEQAPISDLRTAPHSDALSAEQVDKIEAEKHDLDNQAFHAMSQDNDLVIPQKDGQTVATLDHSASSSALHTPPPAPEPAHATLPAEAAKVSSSERSTVSVVGRSIGSSQAIPTEQPTEPAPTPVVPSIETMAAQDQEMTDVAAPVVKAVHGRDEDVEMEQRAPKRMKTEEEQTTSEHAQFKVPLTPAPIATDAMSTSELRAEAEDGPQHGSNVGSQNSDDVVTAPRLQHMKKVISNLKKSNASAAFRLPVDPVALNIPGYFDVVKTPMDLSTIDGKLKHNQYSSMSTFVTDFDKIVANCIAFNGPDHTVTQQGRKMESSFRNQMQHLPGPGTAEPARVEKKTIKPKVDIVRPAPRRSSMSAKAASPKAPVATPAFAPGPDGMPLIRRDSALDGRPKRAIVPPKRNSDFGGARPKKKKYELQLRFCDEVLKSISATKHWQFNQYFTHPVDPVALNIPTYFQVVKKPMDLLTIRQKLDGGMYEKAKDFEEDVRLIFKNCFKFNPEGDFVNQCGRQLEGLFNQEWAQKDEWIAAHEPASEPVSGGEEEDEEEVAAATEEDEPESEDERLTQIKELQAQIAAMSQKMGELSKPKKKKATPPVAVKKTSGSTKEKKKAVKASTTFPNLKPKKEKKAAGKPKPEKDRYVTYAEKQYISNGIAMLPEKQMQEALRIIQQSVPALANSDQNEIELDIEEVPNHALLKLLTFVKKFAGPPPEEVKADPDSFATSTKAASKPKKSKPTGKRGHEAEIASLQSRLEMYQRPGSPDAVQSVETGGDSSDESGDSEESEEE